MSSQAANLNTLFSQATQSGYLGPDAYKVLTGGLGNRLKVSLGVPVDSLTASECFIMALLLDDSSSIRLATDGHGKSLNNIQNVMDGSNLVLSAVKASKSVNDIIVMVSTLNRGNIFDFTPIGQAPDINGSNYIVNGGTPLYDRGVDILRLVLAKEQELRDAGVPCRTATLLVTDGHDEGSRSRATDFATVARDMLMRENHIIAGLGIEDGYTDFRQVFGEMGLQSDWILTPANSPSEIRKAFQVFSRSAAQASQGAGGFSQALGSGLQTP